MCSSARQSFHSAVQKFLKGSCTNKKRVFNQNQIVRSWIRKRKMGWCESTRMGDLPFQPPLYICCTQYGQRVLYWLNIRSFLSVISLCLDKTKILQIYKVLKVSKTSFEVWNQASKPLFRISWDCVWHLTPHLFLFVHKNAQNVGKIDLFSLRE